MTFCQKVRRDIHSLQKELFYRFKAKPVSVEKDLTFAHPVGNACVAINQIQSHSYQGYF